jgi:ubiquinone/menaquinone biosynthesis C-methylase UbiE
VNGIAAAYDASGSAWRSGPERVYERLADALLDHAPLDLVGARVLDIGAGTGVASRVALRRGAAEVVATDVAAGMLAHCDEGITRVVADAHTLPFPDARFDLAVAAFSLGHLHDPAMALRETRRVAGTLAASAFDPSWSHPAKAAVDEAMAGHGFVMPQWYVDLKSTESLVEDPARLARLARSAGYPDVTVSRLDVDAGLNDPAAVVDWRWGMAHLAPFVATLATDIRARARRDAESAVVGLSPVVVPMLALTAG